MKIKQRDNFTHMKPRCKRLLGLHNRVKAR